jgi:hypothetical protein
MVLDLLVASLVAVGLGVFTRLGRVLGILTSRPPVQTVEALQAHEMVTGIGCDDVVDPEHAVSPPHRLEEMQAYYRGARCDRTWSVSFAWLKERSASRE